jgi:hypothetical protein
MKNRKIHLAQLAVAVSAAIAAPAVFACSSCGCTLSSDWDSQGYAVTPGLRIDLRYDYLNQSQLRSGTGKVDRGSISFPTDKEIEQGTKNQYTTLGFDYSTSKNWGINVQVPYIYRTHTTIAEGDVDVSSSKTSNIGDIRILGRYQGLSDDQNIGLQFGLKLPTGSFHDVFRDGPQAGGDLDRGLQAGTGTTDLLLGAFHFGPINQNWDYFAQGVVQQAFAERDGYKSGTSLNVNAGVRYMASEEIIPQLQINAKTGARDSGVNADRDNSGGTLIYLSPGITMGMGKNLKAFGFLQLPVYQKVNGFQLAPRYTFSVGIRYAL